MSVSVAFAAVLSLAGRPMTLKRLNGGVPDTLDIRIAPSNLFRQIRGPEELTINANEVVIVKSDVKDTVFDPPVKTDKIIDADSGTQTIDAVIDMFMLGELVGWRIRFR